MLKKSRRINTNGSNQQTMMQARILSTVGMKRESDAKYAVSYGGGINSTAMIVYLVKNNLPLDYVVFSDTGDEMPETYEYLEVIRQYLKRRNIPFEVVRVRDKTSLSDRCRHVFCTCRGYVLCRITPLDRTPLPSTLQAALSVSLLRPSCAQTCRTALS